VLSGMITVYFLDRIIIIIIIFFFFVKPCKHTYYNPSRNEFYIYLGNKKIYCIFETCCIMFYCPKNAVYVIILTLFK